MLQVGGETVEKWLFRLYNDALQRGSLPTDWTAAEIVPLFKKGDVTERNNYRPISLLSHSYKAMAKSLQKRIEAKEETILDEEQAGFRAGRGTTDQIFSFSQLTERMWEMDRDVFCQFIDSAKSSIRFGDPRWNLCYTFSMYISDISKSISDLSK